MKKVIKIFKNRIFRICTGGVLFAAALIVHGFGMWNLALALDIAALLISGAPVFVDAARGILRRDLLDEKFLMSRQHYKPSLQIFPSCLSHCFIFRFCVLNSEN